MRFIGYLLWVALIGCQSAALTSAKLYLQEEQTDKAEEQLKAALAADSTNAEAYYLLGKVYGLQGRFEEMSESLNRSLALSPQFADQINRIRRHYWAREYNRGVSLAMADQPDYEEARKAFQTATVIDPEAVQAWRNLAFTDYRLGDMDAAIETYRRLATMASQDTSVFSSLGALCIQEKRYQEAVDALRHLVELDPGNARAYVNLGIAYERLGRVDEAVSAYVRAVELAPREEQAWYALGNFYWNQEKYRAAKDAYARAVELAPQDADALFNLAMTCLKLGDDEAALPLLEKLTALQPDNGAVWRQLSNVYARRDMVEKSREADARAKDLGF